jgi:hypothetical protein
LGANKCKLLTSLNKQPAYNGITDTVHLLLRIICMCVSIWEIGTDEKILSPRNMEAFFRSSRNKGYQYGHFWSAFHPATFSMKEEISIFKANLKREVMKFITAVNIVDITAINFIQNFIKYPSLKVKFI